MWAAKRITQRQADRARRVESELRWTTVSLGGELGDKATERESSMVEQTNEAMKRVVIEGKEYLVPEWVQWIAQESDGEWTGFEVRPLCKMPYAFWKAQGDRWDDGFEICQGTPYEHDMDEVPKHVWPVKDFLSPNATVSRPREVGNETDADPRSA